MTKNFWKIVNHVIRESDILIEVLDARFPELSRNEEIERKIAAAGKKLLLVINKADLSEHIHLPSAPYRRIIVSSRTRRGLTSLRILLKIEAKRLKKEQVTIGVLGYPNTGKSSLINALKGKHAAATSSRSGFTQSLWRVRMSQNISLFDTPGVFPFLEKDEVKHTLLGARDPVRCEFPEDAAQIVLDTFGNKIQASYGCAPDLETIAERLGKKKKGGIFDLKAAAIKILQDWQRGKIG